MAEITENNSIEEEDTLKGRFLTFSLDKETYGIEIKFVTEIIGIQKITSIPELPEYAKGIINLRGKIVPVMDVRLRFKKEPREYNQGTCIIVVSIDEMYIGLIVDRISEVLAIPDENIVEAPKIIGGFSNRYIKEIGKVGTDVKLLLDCEKLLTENELVTLKDFNEAV